MNNVPEELKYAATHEWSRPDEHGVITVGITDHAQDLLGDIVFVELPEVGSQLAASDEAGVVESVKAASDIYMPVAGEIVEINDELEDAPEKVNESPYGEGWFFRIKPDDPTELSQLLDATGYQEVCASE